MQRVLVRRTNCHRRNTGPTLFARASSASAATGIASASSSRPAHRLSSPKYRSDYLFRVWLALVFCACAVEEDSTDELVEEALRAGRNPCESSVIRNRVNVRHAANDPHRF